AGSPFSQARSCRTHRASTPPRKRVNDIATRPPVKDWVAALDWLRTLGATKPPRFPTELMRAIPPAAAAPLRKEFGRDQKGPNVLYIPSAASDSAASASHGDWK